MGRDRGGKQVDGSFFLARNVFYYSDSFVTIMVHFVFSIVNHYRDKRKKLSHISLMHYQKRQSDDFVIFLHNAQAIFSLIVASQSQLIRQIVFLFSAGNSLRNLGKLLAIVPCQKGSINSIIKVDKNPTGFLWLSFPTKYL